jgi:Domain of unknown function (DUF4177)
MAIWEYLITTFSGKPEDLSTWLNEQGKEGWELVAIRAFHAMANTRHERFPNGNLQRENHSRC